MTLWRFGIVACVSASVRAVLWSKTGDGCTCPLVFSVLQLHADQAWFRFLEVPLFIQAPIQTPQALGALQDLPPQRAALPVVHLPVRHHVAWTGRQTHSEWSVTTGPEH